MAAKLQDFAKSRLPKTLELKVTEYFGNTLRFSTNLELSGRGIFARQAFQKQEVLFESPPILTARICNIQPPKNVEKTFSLFAHGVQLSEQNNIKLKELEFWQW